MTQRLQSLDMMRGVIMLLLAAESTHLYWSLDSLQSDGLWHTFMQQFFHHPWNGLRAWDLVQPAFMTIAGTAMYLSWNAKAQKGISWQQNFKHIAWRCGKLFIFGTALHCVYAGRLVWELWNVLTQLSVTTIIAYLIIRRSVVYQLVVSLLLLLATDLMYRFVILPGFEDAFTQGHNFGAYLDTVLMGKINPDGWVAINCIPTAAHTIWGVLAGRLLTGTKLPLQKTGVLVIAGMIGLAAGFGLDAAGITPIIKRISTASFVLASGGWVMLIMALFYWLADVRGYVRYAWIATVAGMNAIFLYLFFETVGAQWVNPTTGIFVKGFTYLLGVREEVREVLSALTVLVLEMGTVLLVIQTEDIFQIIKIINNIRRS